MKDSDLIKEMYKRNREFENTVSKLEKALAEEKKKTPKKIETENIELKRKNRTLKDSLDFIRENYPEIWGN
ncbi:MAG: hypothetical protein ACRC1D_03340 [Culicoidibacterales bacterium]